MSYTSSNSGKPLSISARVAERVHQPDPWCGGKLRPARFWANAGALVEEGAANHQCLHSYLPVPTIERLDCKANICWAVGWTRSCLDPTRWRDDRVYGMSTVHVA